MCHYYNLGALFCRIVDKFSNHCAIKTAQKNYTYQALFDHSTVLINYMTAHDIGRGDVIAIAATKVFDDYALMIACLRIGVIYTNIDIDNPIDRIAAIFASCQVKCVFMEGPCPDISQLCDQVSIDKVIYSQITSVATTFAVEGADIDGDSIAYIMFTSGSTGIPKGAAVSHQNLIHFIAWATKRYAITEDDNFANISPLYFDNSVFDFYVALFNGACLTPIDKALLTQPMAMVDYIDKQCCTLWFSVPTMLIYLLTMRVLSASVLTAIRVFTFGGEGFPKKELKKLYDIYGTQAQLINVYGPTECTCICSSYTITAADFDDLNGLPPLGYINDNFAYMILENNEPSEQGELCLLGPLVSKGYYHDPIRSNRVFSLYTDNVHFNKPMYRTGDLVKLSQGMLYFIGRADNQIKHMGYRIELEEIEFALNSLVAVTQSVVVYQRITSAFGKLFAFVVLNNAIVDGVDGVELSKQLAQKLPSYMIPSVFKELACFPVNANGKVDRKQLEALL